MHWLQTLDTRLFRFINGSLSNPLFDAVMPWFSGNRFFAPLVLLAAAILLWRGRTQALICVLALATVVPLGDHFIINTIKHAVARPRPFATLSDVRLPATRDDAYPVARGEITAGPANPAPPAAAAGKPNSMPSAHAANWFAAMMLLFLYRRRSLWVMLPLALLVCFSRVYNGVHYPSDVLAGAILGAGYAAGFVIVINAAWRAIGKKWFPLWLEKMPSLVMPAPAGDRGLTPPKQQSPATGSESQIASRKSQIEEHWLRAGYVLIVVLTLARWLYLASGSIELSEDEAYQWVWSKHLALSYYSKPPLIAYTQFLGTSLWGDNAFGVRFFSPLIGAVLSFLLLRFFAREASARAGFFLVLIVTATPLLAVGATLMTVDPLSVLFWTAAMLAGWRAIQENSTIPDWLWVGLWMGLGFLSKYTALFQWLCWAVFFVLWPPARRHLRRAGPCLGLAVNLVCALPVIVWNYQHHWITATHVGERGFGNAWQPTARFLIDFLGEEFVLLNPIFLTGIAIALVAMWRRDRKDVRLVYLFSMSAPVFLAYIALTVHSRVLPNWIAPSILPMLCAMVIYWDARRREGARFVKPCLAAGLALGLSFVALLHDTNLVGKIAGRALPPKADPLTRVRAYNEMGCVVDDARAKLLVEGKPVFVIGEHYGITSLLNFYIPEARASVKTAPLVYCPPSEKPQNQYYFWPGYRDSRPGQNALYVREMNAPRLVACWFLKWLAGETNLVREEVENAPVPDWLPQQFGSVTDLGLHEVLYRGRVFHTLQIFECRNLH